jgi:hypothetical protein
MGNFHEFPNPSKRAFLNAFALLGRVPQAAKAAEIDLSLHYKWLKSDPDYALSFKDAQDMAADLLESEAVRRAVQGVDKPVYYKGRQVGTVKEYSDTLLIFTLKGLRPEKYKDRIQVDVTTYLRQMAEENGLDPDEIIKEAQAIVASGRTR